MNILADLQESVGLERLVGRSEEDVKNAFFANYMAAILMLKLQDLKGLLIINDPSHANLNNFTPNMSDLNFWGRALFHPDDKKVVDRLQPGHYRVLDQEAKRITLSRVHQIMRLPLTAPESVNWNEVIATLVLLRERFGVTSSYFKRILYALANWETVSEATKRQAVNAAFMYLIQSDPKSALLSRIRALSSSTMLGALANIAYKLVGFKRLAEDGDGGGEAGTSVGNIGSGADGGYASDNVIANNDEAIVGLIGGQKTSFKDLKLPDNTIKRGKFIFKDNKIVKRKVKKFKARKFKAPDHMRTRNKNV